MLKHLENLKILTSLNHGFRSGYSCTTQLLVTDDFGILSGPMALDGLVFFSNFSTPSTVIFRFCIVEPARCGSTEQENIRVAPRKRYGGLASESREKVAILNNSNPPLGFSELSFAFFLEMSVFFKIPSTF
jgi:hypothetical protein